jgi:hypothetical protein
MSAPETQQREWPWLVLAVACVVGSPVAAYAAQQSTGSTVALFFGIQLVLTGLAFLIPQARQLHARRGEVTAEQRELEARADTRAAVNDALDPILRQLGDISAERSKAARERLIAQAIPFVLNAASNLIGSERSRACWFELTDESPPRLVPRLAAGRSGSPTTTFEAGTTAGDAAINMVTVAAGDTAFGMLTLDALEPGDLSNDDLHMLGLMASALAAALAQRE